jgi:hypothetical protein
MHGPEGGNYPNEAVFAEIVPERRIVVDHVSEPKFVLTISLEPREGGGTRVGWSQAFADPELGRRLEPIVGPANEQNLDRLAEEVARGGGEG